MFLLLLLLCKIELYGLQPIQCASEYYMHKTKHSSHNYIYRIIYDYNPNNGSSKYTSIHIYISFPLDLCKCL